MCFQKLIERECDQANDGEDVEKETDMQELTKIQEVCILDINSKVKLE